MRRRGRRKKKRKGEGDRMKRDKRRYERCRQVEYTGGRCVRSVGSAQSGT
jgi:hypothetical protein